VRLCKQKYKSDCGIASIAALLDISWEDARKAIFPNRKKGKSYATSIDDLISGFARLGHNSNWKFPLKKKRRIGLIDIKKDAILILDFGDNEYHAVSWSHKEKAVYDPLMDRPLYLDEDRIEVSNRTYTMSVQSFYGKKIFAYITIVA
jgi:hypothetical protein